MKQHEKWNDTNTLRSRARLDEKPQRGRTKRCKSTVPNFLNRTFEMDRKGACNVMLMLDKWKNLPSCPVVAFRSVVTSVAVLA